MGDAPQLGVASSVKELAGSSGASIFVEAVAAVARSGHRRSAVGHVQLGEDVGDMVADGLLPVPLTRWYDIARLEWPYARKRAGANTISRGGRIRSV
jgi:hypothetical protein